MNQRQIISLYFLKYGVLALAVWLARELKSGKDRMWGG